MKRLRNFVVRTVRKGCTGAAVWRNVGWSRTVYCMYLDVHVHGGTWRVVSPRLLIEWWDGDWEWDCLWADGTWRALCIECNVANKIRSQMESPPICGNPENTWSEVILPLYILCLCSHLLLEMVCRRMACHTLSSFLIAFDCKPGITTVHN